VTTKQIVQKIIFVVLTLTACCGLVVLLVAAIGKRNHERCKDYVITIKGAQKNLFISEKDIKGVLDTASGGQIKNKLITDFNLRKLEQQIKENPWVQDADLYFDNKEILHVSVQEREPVARIFTTSQRSFYIDSSDDRMPLSGIMSARVPVFTNFPDKRPLSKKDSILLNDIKRTASFILNDSFWMAQVEQIDITPDRNFEMVPTVGDHIVRLGNGDDIDGKFHRLFIFYQQVLSRTSFDKYKVVDVRFAGQVTGTREKISRIDSVQLRKNVEKLLQEARRIQQDTTVSVPIARQTVSSPEQVPTTDKNESKPIIARNQNNSIPEKTAVTTKPKLIDNKRKDKKPNAVMPAAKE
jgi:cell division protein FtsQ